MDVGRGCPGDFKEAGKLGKEATKQSPNDQFLETEATRHALPDEVAMLDMKSRI